MTEGSKFTTISIPTPLANKIKKRIKGTGSPLFLHMQHMF